MSVVVSVGNCQGPQIPARGGRIDATGPGGSGVPAPDTDLPTTLGFFARSGFNQVDAIKLTACGHTMGSVHSGGFPTVVNSSAITPNDTAGGVHLDTTPFVFDDQVVQEYISGTGQMGGPLVTSFNESSRSDLRLYESDNNATMLELASQGSNFVYTCVTLLQRMIETVPKHVTLSEVIRPLGIKPVNASLDFDTHGTLKFSGVIRVSHPNPTGQLIAKYSQVLPSTGNNAPASISLKGSGSAKSTTLKPDAEVGTSVFGNLVFYPFSLSIQNSESFNSFTISGAGINDKKFEVQAGAFVVPSLTSITLTSSSTVVNITTAALKNSVKAREGYNARSLEVIVAAPVPQQGTLAPKVQSWKVSTTSSESIGKYSISTGSIDLGVRVTGAVTVDLLSGSKLLDKYVIGWPQA